MEKNKLSEKESLELITQMIQESRERIDRHAAYPLLIWGYMTLLLSLVMWYVIERYAYWTIQFIWFLLPLICYPPTLYFSRKDRSEGGARNYMERITGQIWTVFGVVALLLSLFSYYPALQGKINIYFYINCIYSASSQVQYVFQFMTYLMIFVIPILTMRSYSEDYKQKTDQLLLTAPVRLSGIVLGKFLAALTVFLIPLAFTLIFVLVVATFGHPSGYTIVGNYIAIIAVASCYISIGCFISSLTKNQLVACVASLAAFVAMYLFDFMYQLANSAVIKNLIYWFSIFRLYDNFTRGIFSFSDFIYYISIAGLFLFFTVRVLEKKRWS